MGLKDRIDGWYNTISGIGSALRDKQQANRFARVPNWSAEALEDLYHGDDLASRISDAIPEEGTRKGYKIVSDDDPEGELNSAFSTWQRDMGLPDALYQAAVWARCTGWGAVWLGIDDGQEDNEPVQIERVRGIEFALPLSRSDVAVKTRDQYGEPETYDLRTDADLIEQLQLRPVPIHRDRLLIFPGATTSRRRRRENEYFPEAPLARTVETIESFGVTWKAISHLVQDAGQGVFKFKGLMQSVAQTDCTEFQARMEALDMGRSVARAVLVDADGEDFRRDTYAFNGLPEIAQLWMLRVAGAARMPVTVLFGQAPAGLNATGESDLRLWYDRVGAWQTKDHQPQVRRLVDLFGAFALPAPENYEVKYEPLRQMSDLEQAELEKTIGERDVAYIAAGVLMPEEVALNRFTPQGFSLHTQIDLEARTSMLADEMKLAIDGAGQPPPEVDDGEEG